MNGNSEDLYGGDGPTLAQEPAPDAQKKKPEQEQDGKTFLINKDVCPGMAVGDEMVVKIEGIHENEYEVSYAPEHKDEPAKEGGEQEGMADSAPEGGTSSNSNSLYG